MYKVLLLVVGNGLTLLTQFSIIFTLAKFSTPESVGYYALCISIVNPLFIFTNMKLRSVIATDVISEFNFNHYFTSRFILSLISFMISVIIIFFINKSIIVLMILTAGLKFIESLSDAIYGRHQLKNNELKIGYSLIIKNTMSIIIFFIIYFISGNILFGLSFILIIYGITFLIFDKKGINIKPIFTKKKFLSILFLSIGLGVSGLMGSLVNNIPRYVLEHEGSSSDLGIYSALSYFVLLGSVFITSISQIVTPRLAKLFVENKSKEFIKLLISSALTGYFIGIILVIIIYLFGYQILTLLYNKTYANYIDSLMYLTMGFVFVFGSAFFGTALNSMRIFNKQVMIHLFSLITIVVLSSVYIPQYGILGAAKAVMYTNILTAIVYIIFFVYFYLKRKVNHNDI